MTQEDLEISTDEIPGYEVANKGSLTVALDISISADLKKEGVWVDEKMEESEFGKFGWIMDCEGNRIELWEPPKQA